MFESMLCEESMAVTLEVRSLKIGFVVSWCSGPLYFPVKWVLSMVIGNRYTSLSR